METPNGRVEINQLFGNPANSRGELNEAWEGANIRLVAPPNGWRLFYQDDHGVVVPVSGIRIDRLLREVFIAVLDDIWDRARQEAGSAATDDDVRKWLHDRRLDLHGGGFNFRPIRGHAQLSLHSYGIAIDWDPDHNPQGSTVTTLPAWWYEIWNHHGWHDGRTFPTPDPMHVQFATGA